MRWGRFYTGSSNQGDGFAAEAEEGSSPRGSGFCHFNQIVQVLKQLVVISDGSPAFMELQDSSVDHGRHLTASPICNMINEHINICIIHFLVHQIYKTCYSNISLVINWWRGFKNMQKPAYINIECYYRRSILCCNWWHWVWTAHNKWLMLAVSYDY